MATYSASFLHDSGGIEEGYRIEADTDGQALKLARTAARHRRAHLYRLNKRTGADDDGTDMFRPVPLNR